MDCLWSEEHWHIFSFFVQADQVDETRFPGQRVWAVSRAESYDHQYQSYQYTSIGHIRSTPVVPSTLIDAHSYCECWIGALSSLRNTAEIGKQKGNER